MTIPFFARLGNPRRGLNKSFLHHGACSVCANVQERLDRDYGCRGTSRDCISVILIQYQIFAIERLACTRADLCHRHQHPYPKANELAFSLPDVLPSAITLEFYHCHTAVLNQLAKHRTRMYSLVLYNLSGVKISSRDRFWM
jgi:hypothetical protein